jgi:broad specificity phosphatase PhoE
MADKELPMIYLARHGETAWSLSGQHTGLTDLPLTETGERNAQKLRGRLSGKVFDSVFTSPLRRAIRTCELAGFGSVAEIDPNLLEWDYGEYEGRRSVEIHAERPDWQLFETVPRVANHHSRLPSEPIALWTACAQFQGTF